MARLFLFICLTLALHGAASAGEPWSGNWQVDWEKGGALLELSQSGSDVRGSYLNGHGQVTATASGNQLDGFLTHDGLKEDFSATLGTDHRSFSGWTSAGDWLTGRLVAPGSLLARRYEADLRSPRSAMRSLLNAGNLARDGNPQALAEAVEAIDFGESPEWSSREAKFSGAERLFGLVDLATFGLASIPEHPSSSRLTLSLPRLDTTSSIDIEMAQAPDGNWRITMPDSETLRRSSGSDKVRTADGFRQLQNPRDTLRTFLEGMSRWDRGGDQQAIATLELSGVADVIRQEQGRLIANYLIRIIDRVGRMPLQSVPNSGASRAPFIYFAHPAGRIVIVPVGTGPETRWLFSSETVEDARRLYAAVQSLPETHTLDPQFLPPSPMLAIRDSIKAYAPALLSDVGGRGRIEYWQLLGGLLVLSAMIVATLAVSGALTWLLGRPALAKHIAHPRRLAYALGIALAFAAGSRFVPYLGLPSATRQYSVPVIGSLLVIILTYAVWQIIGVATSLLDPYAERTETPIDNILLTFVRGVFRLLLLGAAGLVLGHLWSVPTSGVLAGLGIGGLAVAFASKETLANVFGAGILLGDRPFRKGDRIIAGDVNGWVEAVGLRSTRIRTLYDSLLIVPNGKLADTTINNLGARRRRTLTTTVVVTSGSTPQKLLAFTTALSKRMCSDPFFDPGTEVNIIGITATGVQIEISTSLNTRRGTESRAATHRLFLDILHMAEAEGLTLGRGMEKRPVYLVEQA